MNTIPQTLRRSLILNSAMEAFKHRLVSLGLFSTVLRNLPLEGNNEIDIPYIPLATSASKDFDGSYKFDKGDLESRKITVNKRKYQSLTYTSEEKARQPYFDPIVLGRLKGEKLAEDVLLDILSVITKANFGDAILTSTAANFDTDDIIDLETRLDELEWPDAPRGMILKSSYLANVKKDIKESGGISNFGFSALGNLPNLLGFSFSKFNRLPENGEHLQGFVVYPSAIMVALAPIRPTENVMKQLSTYTTYTDPQTGLTLEYRAWGDADSDTSKEIIECNYGFGVGESAALKRIVSA